MNTAMLPHMDAEGLKCFMERIAHSKCYLEYGAGSSTTYAANTAKVPEIFSVDSDISWCEKVRTSVESASKLTLDYCDIGVVGEWGMPTANEAIGRYWRYLSLPWRSARFANAVPDLVLIDGRFRVACFLYSLVSARAGTEILFDDYFDRPHYFVAEQFCELHERHGRMGAFIVKKNFAVSDICERIAEYSIRSA